MLFFLLLFCCVIYSNLFFIQNRVIYSNLFFIQNSVIYSNLFFIQNSVIYSNLFFIQNSKSGKKINDHAQGCLSSWVIFPIISNVHVSKQLWSYQYCSMDCKYMHIYHIFLKHSDLLPMYLVAPIPLLGVRASDQFLLLLFLYFDSLSVAMIVNFIYN